MKSNIITNFEKKITIKLFNLKTMNYSTLKKTVALSFASLLAVSVVNAQTDAAKTDSTKASAATGTAKVFGGTKQYNTWSLGLNVGVTAPSVATGGVNVFNHNQPSLGYGASLRDQLSHTIGLQLDVRGGQVKGSEEAKFSNPGYVVDPSLGQVGSFKTNFFQATLSGVVNVGS